RTKAAALLSVLTHSGWVLQSQGFPFAPLLGNDRDAEGCWAESLAVFTHNPFSLTVDEEDEYECVSVLNAHTQDVKHVVWHPNQELLASASYDDTVKLYREEEDDWVCCATLEGHESTVWSLAFDQSGERLASCSDDKTVRIWHQYKPGNEQGEQGKLGAVSYPRSHSYPTAILGDWSTRERGASVLSLVYTAVERGEDLPKVTQGV
uniref:Cytosolic iron-sulfur protein assembly protein CIAO1 n=1 Tax=Chelydra serpentina TaxID=8475 RepID=A0A8C3SHF4_CHESE